MYAKYFILVDSFCSAIGNERKAWERYDAFKMKTILTIALAFSSLSVFGQCYKRLDQTDTSNKTITLKEYQATGKTPHSINHNGYSMSFWSSNGKIAEEGLELDHEKNGIWIAYYPSGKIKSIISYWHGQEDGVKKLFYENGQIELEGYHFRKETPQYREEWGYNAELKDTIGTIYVLNPTILKHGTWNEYNSDGKLLKATSYNMGEIIWTKEY